MYAWRMSAFLSFQNVLAFRERARADGRTVVTTNGAFDLLSAAHVRLLRRAKDEGDVLIVGVNSDLSVRTLKGDRRPIVPGAQRAEIIAALSCVDAVFLFNDLDPRRWLLLLQPDVHVNSAEYGENCVESPVLREIGARLVLVPRSTDVLSTSDYVAKILESVPQQP